MVLNCYIVSDPEAVILLSAWINYKNLHLRKKSIYGEDGYSLPGFEWFLKSVSQVSTSDMNKSIYPLFIVI